MEVIIQILILFIVVNTALKLSFWKWWQTLIFAAIAAIFILWIQQYAIGQSKLQLQNYLNNKQALQDMAVLITAESAVSLAFCIATLRNMFGKKEKRWVKLLYWYPSLLLFPVLYYLLTQSIFSLPGISFSSITFMFSGAIFIVLPALAYGLKLLIPEKELRLEIYFLVSLFVAILGLLTTVDGNVTYAAAKEPLNIKAILYSVTLFLLLFAIGYFWNKYKRNILKKYRGDKKNRIHK